ncbi:hypothetical protein P4O66_017651 [Electrophorus voltai]|uniref:Uncharacterized protein n=1 Tax=Electrophorus voltai TaxID=2609070 RepID=A0AAD9DN64_9TELE|nr:hypothetical protein P4O66_017651 [Electrophorus voltai]
MWSAMYRWFSLLFSCCQAWGEHLKTPSAFSSGVVTSADGFECMSHCNLSRVTPCPPGLISTDDGVDCRLCPAGFSCEAVALTACRNGQYSPEGHTQCLPCPFGFVCVDGFQKKAVMASRFSFPHHLARALFQCRPGEEPSLNRSECIQCPQGYFSTLCSAQCELCPAGTYCPYRGMSQPVACGVGQYTDKEGQSSCKSCEGSVACGGAIGAGRAGGQPRVRAEVQLGSGTKTPVSCPPGTHRDGVGPGCHPCPLGHYCVGGVAMQCPAGRYGPKEGLQRERDCVMCPAGFYCLEGTSRRPGSQFLCPQGYYCEEGTAVPHGSPCPAGTAGGQLGQTSRAACNRCAEGRYCPAGSAGPGLLCARGRYCPAGTVVEVRCPRGTFTPHQGALSVKDCLKCPGGFYCPEGTSDPLPCQPGTFNPLEGQDALADCRPCYPGKACTQVALKSPDVDCMPGFVCPPGTARPNDPANACPPGTLSNQTDLTDRSQCHRCPARYACLRGTGGIQRPPLSCFPGHFCPAGTMFPTQHKCPAGTWSERSGLESENECRPCPRGWYCLPGVGTPSGRCTSGHYCPEGSTLYGTQFPCPWGTYSTKMGNGGKENCIVCPEGYYCKEGTSKPTACPPATFRQMKGGQRLEDCFVCPAGYSCPHAATVNPRVCGTGSYSVSTPSAGDEKYDMHYLNLGRYVYYIPSNSPQDEGSEECLPCLPGHYCSDETTSEEAMRRVMVCPPGFLCSKGLDREPQRSAILCPIGFYCPGGGINPNPIACPNGTYSDQPGLRQPSDCTMCPVGRYCFSPQPQEQPITQPTGGCPDGYYCPLGTGHPLSFPCESGFFRNESHGHSGGACEKCPAGHYCAGVATRTPSVCPETPLDGHTGGLCPPGSFCPPGSAHPQPCPSGTFSNSTGLTHEKQCIRCPAGYYCLGSNLTSPTGLCSAGYYCTGASTTSVQYQTDKGHYSPEGAVTAMPCPLGTFQPGTYGANPGAEKVQHCGPCDAGQYCHIPGLSAPQGPCEPGFYCSGGANTATPVNFRFGDVCPAGYYCPKGTRHSRQYPCPPGTWGNVVGAQNMSYCWLCPAGFYCNSTGLSQPTGICSAGFYCTGGSKTSMPEDGVTGNRCPAGYYCPQGCTSPQHCPDGTYSNTTGATKCSNCPPGWLCPEGEEVQLCPEGHYCLGGTVEDVLPCPPGTYNSKAGQSQVEQCSLCSAGINFRNPDGNFSTGVGGACPVGHYCPEGSSLPLPCPLGTFSSSLYTRQSSDCSLCPAGQFCGSVGLSRPSGPCQEGFYCPSGATSPTGSGTDGGLCPRAHFCPVSSAMPLPCPAGSYTNLTGQFRCSPCHAGYYCPENTSSYTQFPCPPGFYCPNGTKHATQFPCPRGYYNPEPMTQSLDSCLPCPPGHYCERERLTSVSGKCKAGWFCVSAAWSPQPFDLDNYTNANCLCPATSTGGRCQAGYYCPTGSSEPVSCPPGAFCNATGLALMSGPCSSGYYCIGEATEPKPTDGVTGDVCPPGFYCPEGTSEPEPCPAGTFSPAAGLKSQAECQPCTAGHYCRSRGLTAPTARCSQGYWCLPGQTADLALPCPMGHRCPSGSSAPVLCPSGTYQDQWKQANCMICGEGKASFSTTTRAATRFYCDENVTAANVSLPQPCIKGHYCPKGTSYATQFPCPVGTYNPREGMASLTGCLLCPSGHFCPTLGLAEPAGLCFSGYWCREGSHTASPSGRLSILPIRESSHTASPSAASIGSLCPVGHYCPKGTSSPVPCPAGTWSDTTGMKSEDECQLCPGGFYCATAGLMVPSGLCSEGFYCVEKAKIPTPTDGTSGNVCPEGHYCPRGTTRPMPCDPGTFMTATQASQCWPCTAGWYCVDGAQLPCPQGFYCMEGTGYDWVPCPPGTYSPDPGLRARSQCRECNGGHYCAHQNATSVSGHCSAGYHCSRGNISPKPSTWSAGEGGPCPVGYYCPQGTADPQACPEGTFSNRTRLTSQDECVPCLPGRYCNTTGLTSPTGECWEGFYCKQGASLPNALNRDSRGGPCPTGSSGTLDRGFFCPANGSAVEGSECPVGHYCPPGTSLEDQHPCPPGTINPYKRKGSLDDCTLCPPGFFCEASGQGTPSGPCVAGHFCLSGAVSPIPEDGVTGDQCPPGYYCLSGSSSPQPCPLGHYSTSNKSTELSACVPCPAGFACSNRGLSAPSHVCHAGYYCPQGQNSSQPADYVCSPGHRCPARSPAQMACAPGTYQSLHGQAECVLCLPGFFCAGSFHPGTGTMGGCSTPAPCPLGHYCPAGTQFGEEFPCPAGTYAAEIGLSSMEQCTPCPAGQYCGSPGLASPSGDCSPGYVCMRGSSLSQPPGDITGRKCTAGFYCPSGTSHMQPCPPGTFSSLEGAVSLTECQSCSPGQYCGDYGLSAPSGPCRPGYYCVLSSASPTPHRNRSSECNVNVSDAEHQGFAEVHLTGDVCTAGHYCPSGSSQPLPCPPGQQCPPGHSCPYGSAEPSVCPSGTYQSRPSQPSCQTCPPGFYCPDGASTPMPCPAGTLSQVAGLLAKQDCTPCAPGFYCNASALTSPSGPCIAGHFCLSGATEPSPVSQVYGDICPSGHYCPESSSAPLPCPVGHFLPDKGASSIALCLPCLPGRYCPTLGSSQPSGFCTAGHYCTGGSETAAPHAKPSQRVCFRDTIPEFCDLIPESGHSAYCPARPAPTPGSNADCGRRVMCAGFRGDICPTGFYCPVGSSLPQLCDAGSHCNQTGLQTPAALCPAGFYCPKGSWSPFTTPCPVGHYCPRGTTLPLPCLLGTLKSTAGGGSIEHCSVCPSGYFCDQRGLTEPSGLCSKGYYCPGGQNSSQPLEHKCRVGHYCEEGSVRGRACPVGSYQPCEGQHECEVCLAGFSCPEEGKQQHFNRRSWLICLITVHERECLFTQGMTHPAPCEPGFYCPAGTANQKPCPAGTYGNRSGMTEASECTPCDPGTYCAGAGSTSPTGPCTAGFLCFGAASLPSPTDNVTGSQCPPGSYCLSGSLTPTLCPKGTFSVQPGLKDAGQCQSCSPGFFCSEPGLSTLSGPCLPGYYCTEGSPTAAPVSAAFGDLCPPGHYCGNGSTVPTPCPAGTHRPERGGKGTGDCMPCPGGLFQDQKGQKECKPCPPGFHCPSSTQRSDGSSAPLICPEGYYCPNDTLSGRPVPCPKGTYSNTQGLSTADECLVCPLGYFCASHGLVQPSGRCASGFLCFVRATVPNPNDNDTGTLCPPGAYCQLGVKTGDCSPGYYCNWGSSSPDQTLCPAGFFCPTGTDRPIACGAGTFSSVMGNSVRDNCEPCPAGYYCQGEGVVEPAACPQGFYCPLGTVIGTEFPCPQGTMESVSNNVCPPGHYCPVGTGYPFPCPAGTFSSTPGLSRVEQCQPCPPGHFCEQPAMVRPSDAVLCDAGYVCLGGSRSARPVDGLEGYLCPSGYGCSIGTSAEVPCQPGTYSSAPGAAHCLPCPAGTMCPSSATQEPSPCPKGHFCPAGSATGLQCPAGTLGLVSRAQSEDACVACPAGLYCGLPGASQPQGPCQEGYFCQSGSSHPAPLNTSNVLRNGPCPQGHFCPSGTLSPLPCPAGSVRNLTGGSSIESCLPCPSGYYCASEGLDSPSGPCAAGFYCPAGFSSTTPHPFLCPKGHYCPSGSALALPCPMGQYQPNPGSDSCIPCRPGFYCEEVVLGDPLPCPPHSYCPAATMVPRLCPNGTYTPPDIGGLQDERECLPCPSGRFCRGGRIQGPCAAGYWCVSGSSELSPQGTALHNRSQWFYCPEGSERPQACPANTLKETVGGRSINDCLPCPSRHWCKEGDPVLYMCPEGHYCDGIIDYESKGRPGPKECPQFTYRPTAGAGSKGHCVTCPPGTFCNATGLTDFSSFPCPSGYWCSGTGLPVPCPAGTMSALPGAASASQCEPCAAGTFCPDPRLTGQPNTAGIPCRASYQCPTGSAVETLCRAGSFCRPQTGEPTPCPAGYYCPEGSRTYNTPQQVDGSLASCTYPHYCPANSSTMLSCDGGFMPLNTSGPRVSHNTACILCKAGTYRPSHSPHLHCFTCPPGYHCPPGADHFSGQSCPVGHICPLGSSSPVPCPPGTYGNRTNAELLEECHQCPPGTFNHLHGQRACFPCGSSSTSGRGAASCTCMGKHRAFQRSDGSCLCKAGYVFYDELDFKSSSADSDLDCQPEVNKRCGAGQVRLASSQECVSPSQYSCNITCGPQGGSLDVGLGVCHCEVYVSAEELCDALCMSTLPLLSVRLSSDGQLLLRIKEIDESRTWSRKLLHVLGPDAHVSNIGNLHFVQFSTEGLFGWILKDIALIDTFLSEPFEILDGNHRERRHLIEEEFLMSRPLSRIRNPIACLSPSDMLIFQITINFTGKHICTSDVSLKYSDKNMCIVFNVSHDLDRLLSHFPVYQKDHLFSSNPAWDFGSFRRLSRLIRHSRINSTRFAHVFSEPGQYVFTDNAVPDWSLVVVVRDIGTECDRATFQPASPAQLVRHGVIRKQRLNLLPDWVTITVVTTVSALLLGSNRTSLIAHGRPKPKWRSLGQPSVPAEYIYSGEPSGPPGLRGAGEGAEAEEAAVRTGCKNTLMELEEFNVKTLYDKLEDQNLHIASQLAKHRKDTQEFYRNICQQTDALQDILENMEPSKAIEWKKMMENDTQAKKELIRVEPWLGLTEAVIRSLEAVLCGLNRENTAASRHRDTAESERHTSYTQVIHPAHLGPRSYLRPMPNHLMSSADMSKMKIRPDTEVTSSDPTGQSSTAAYVSEEDLGKLVALTPLTRTLQDIQQSLQALGHTPRAEQELSMAFSLASSEEANGVGKAASDILIPNDAADGQPAHLIPVALDNLPPRCFAVFLFGCQVARLLSSECSFPTIMLLPARALPLTRACFPCACCHGNVYYDTPNQILYVLESKLQNAGEFVSVLLHSMAYISSGSAPKDVSRALHLAISALSTQLFHVSFAPERLKDELDEESSQVAFGTLVEDFLSIQVPTETQFSPALLAERLQDYKYFKLEQLLLELKPPPPKRSTHSPGRTGLKMPVQVLCAEQELERLNEVYQQLSSRLSGIVHTEESQLHLNKALQEQASMLKLQQHTVEQKLKEMRERLSKFSPVRRAERQGDSPSQTTEQAHPVSQSPSPQLNSGADVQGPGTE